ncbi:AAA family ATPase [Streptomyces sp. NPDC048172]|uniref:ATP-binding protein n=1 Tax=Streptomyces sp. NPDC048172 TaxID=3365505 RepID=UPI00371BC2F3
MDTPALIGREHPARLLTAELDRTSGSHGGLVLVTGEAGIGKTALVAEVLGRARGRGVLVVSGTCWEREGAPGYWPWVQVVRGLRRALGEEEWRRAAAAAGESLAFLLGEAAAPASTPGTPAGTSATSAGTSVGTSATSAGASGVGRSSDERGFRLSDAVTTLLVTVAQERPVAVVLEDLHWADTESVRLLEFVVQHTWFERLLVIGTYRDAEIESGDHPLAPLLQPLAAKARTVTLTGLGPREVAALMARTAGREPAPDLATEVHRRTGGNPFFVEQSARLWHSGNSITAIAPGVRSALRSRLALLPSEVAVALTAAAVLGREFHPELVAACVDLPAEDMDRLLGQAVAARLVVPLDEGRFAFVHDLVRETLSVGLEGAESVRRHAAVIRALERAPALRRHAGPSEVARHAYLAAGELDVTDVVEHLLAAARDASARLALEEAVGHYGRALELIPADLPHRRAAVALDLGAAQYQTNDLEGGRRTLEEAAAAARVLGDDELLARVALTLHSLALHGGDQGGQGRVGDDVLADAYRTLTPEPGEAQAPPAAPSLTPYDHAQELSVRAVVLARKGQDDEALAFSLRARHDAIWSPGSVPERQKIIEEMAAVARRTADAELELHSSSLYAGTLLEQGDPRFLEEHLAFVGRAERSGLPRHVHAALSGQGAVATMTGRFAEAREFIDRAYDLGEQPYIDRAGVWYHQRWALCALQGRYEEIDGLLESAGREDTHLYPRLIEATTAVQRGDVGPALRYLTGTAALGEPHVPWFTPLWLRFQAQTAAASGDPELVAEARAALAPYLGQWAVSVAAYDIQGPYVLWSAMLDAAQERWGAAVDGFTAACRAADRFRARPWATEARARLAAALVARGAGGDGETAARLLDEAEQEAVELGMTDVLQRVRRTRDGEGTTAGSAVPGAGAPGTPEVSEVSEVSEASEVLEVREASETPEAPETPEVLESPEALQASEERRPEEGEPDGTTAVFRLDDGMWTLSFAGRTVHVPDAKGLRDLHVLISSPGTEVPAARLLAPEGGDMVVAARSLGGDAVLDEEAKTRYRHRLTLLDEEIERALDLGQDRRAATLDEERQALLDELRGAAGLLGRTRRLGDESERARKTVTARIRHALRRLGQRHPELAAHLRETVSTGATCCYRAGGGTRSWSL